MGVGSSLTGLFHARLGAPPIPRGAQMIKYARDTRVGGQSGD